MKGNKKLLVVAVLLLLLAVSYSTYAIYKSSATGTGSVNAAAWVVKVQSGSQSEANIVTSNTFTLDDITWDTTNRVGQNNTIAPGDHGTVQIKIDADGSQVAVDYVVAIDVTALNNPNFTVTADSNGDPLIGTINYSATAGAMEKTITLNVVWTAVDDDTPTTGANAKDIALQGTQLSIPVTVTATQRPNPAA